MKTQRLQAGWGAFLVCLLLTVAPVGFLTACRPVAPDAEAETADRRTSAESVEEAIARLVTEAAVSEAYQMLLGEKPERYTFDSAAYLLEYTAPWDYWDRVQGADYGEWVAPLQETAPDVYIPLRGDIADTAAVVSNRVIGYIKLQYRPLH